jgi:hypothetical protein
VKPPTEGECWLWVGGGVVAWDLITKRRKRGKFVTDYAREHPVITFALMAGLYVHLAPWRKPKQEGITT